MSQIQYIVGDATTPQGSGRKIIAHVCNDVGAWGKGFVLALSKRFPEPEAAYRRWHAEQPDARLPLGEVQFVEVRPDLWVANMVGQQGIRATKAGPPIRYDALEAALGRVAERALALEASVHMPRIGAGLAGGRWEEIEPIIERTLAARGVTTFVYDLTAA